MSISKNVIIHIKKNTNTEDNVNEILPGYIQNESTYEEKSVQCWNCAHPFNMRNLKHMPIKYISNIFYVTGYFCTNSCCLRYIYDNYKNKELWEKYELYNFYYQKLYGKKIEINIPPDKLFLKMFGGTMDIEDYRDNDNISEIIIPSLVMVSHCISVEKSDKNNKHEFKLSRKKKKENTILTNFEQI